MDVTCNVAELQSFKRDLNENIDAYINSLVNNDPCVMSIDKRSLMQVMSYYNRMKFIHENRREDDDEDDVKSNNEDNDDDAVLSEDDEEYTNLMRNNVYTNHDDDDDIQRQLLGLGVGSKIQRQLRGLGVGSKLDRLDYFDDYIPEEDSSVDPNFYQEDEHNGDYIANNTRHRYITFEPKTEIIVDTDEQNYDEPSLE